MRVRYTPQAFADRENIFAYINERNPHAAREIIRLITRRIAELGDEPYNGHKANKGGIYTLWITPSRYRIYYRINHDEDEVAIIRVKHTSQHYGPDLL